MGIRTAALQVGYLLGAAIGGLAVSLGGYALLGWTLSALFVAGVLPHTWALAAPRRPVRARRRTRGDRDNVTVSTSRYAVVSRR